MSSVPSTEKNAVSSANHTPCWAPHLVIQSHLLTQLLQRHTEEVGSKKIPLAHTLHRSRPQVVLDSREAKRKTKNKKTLS